MRSKLMGLLALAVAGLSASRSEGVHRFPEARALIIADVESGDVPAFAVAVGLDGDVLWQEAFGDATTDTMFSLASVSKPLTATGLMVLVERGEVGLDRPVNDYLGDAPLRARVGRAEDATLRRVANHTSGLPLHHHFFPLDAARRPPPMAETIRRYGNLVTEPGDRWEYSNLGYAVIEHAIERVSKLDFATFMEREVFRPLGMRNTAVVLDPAVETRSLAVRHDAEGRAIPFYDFDHRGASAIYSSVEDLLRFGRFHVRELDLGESSILSQRAVAEMQEPEARVPGSRHYGIGWMIYENRWGEEAVEHGGDMPGVSTSLYLIPERKIVVVALASTRTELPDQVTNAVLDELLDRFETRVRRIRVTASKRTEPRDRKDNNPKDFVGIWEGVIETYERIVPLRLVVDREAGVRARLDGVSEVRLLGPHFDDDRLTGLVRASLGLGDEPPETMLRFSLYRRGNRLSGAITMLADDSGFPLALSHWAELEKQPTVR